MHAGKTAVWYCDECSPDKSKYLEPCPSCCGFRNAIQADDAHLTQGMRIALVDLLAIRERTSVAWAELTDVPKTASAALERRGLVVINRYLARIKLSPAGIRLAEELSS